VTHNYVLYIFVRKLWKKIKLFSYLVTPVVVKNYKSIDRVIYAIEKPIDPMRRINYRST